ncbi:hypothetical protein Clacol_003718 [Clathrus columnatus]|uniref:SMP-LTD domain-containing protein n=1 Tax=Clathrus columnatus TaxID=1419009 RepID=A0AAV5A5C9_9AGAM|nr:hypothetical protein Clacol_003718 [Clathrus columnatus]
MTMGELLSFHPTFTQGFIFGQLSIILLLAFILKYLFFGSVLTPPYQLPTSTFTTTNHFENQSSKEQVAKNLKKSESVEWLNLIVEEIINTYRAELCENKSGVEGIELARQKIERQLNSLRPPTLMDPILVHSLTLGKASPRISNARIQLSSDNSESQIVLSLPGPLSSEPAATFALAPDFRLELNTNSLIGSRAKLADVPKLHDLIESEIKKVLARRGSWTVVLPGIARKQQQEVPYDTKEIDVRIVSERQNLPRHF